MSWQGNECYVLGIEYKGDKFAGRMFDAMEELTRLYDEHGKGWFMLGNFEPNGDEADDYDPFEPKSYMGGAPGCGCWMPNPFMEPGVYVMRVRNAHDLLEAAFECADCHYEAIAYAGDGEEPLERMEVYGEVHDMRR